ncbi:MAG TPA: aldo/keto reductase, partial [archaeon]|nr:aldo/keto reductase [archaeon]
YGDGDKSVIDVVEEISSQRGVPMAQIALAWVLKNPMVASPIVGPTKAEHLADAVGALDISLTPDEIEKLEASYTPHAPTGYV